MNDDPIQDARHARHKHREFIGQIVLSVIASGIAISALILHFLGKF